MATADALPTTLAAPAPRDLSQHRLDNGLRVVLHRDDRLPLVAIHLWYHVGSKNERPGLTGFAHLFEHMLFQGSAHVSGTDHFRYVQQVGGVLNGSTWYDRTNYYETLPSSHLDLGLWLESDRMGFFLPALDEERLARQKQVVMNERLQRVDNQPYGRAGERLHELLYPAGHPYHWPVIGYMDDIAAATLEDVRAFFRANYGPANAVLALAGRFDPAEALDRVERWFGPLAGSPPPPPVMAPPATPGERRDRLTDEVGLARVSIAHEAPPYGDPGWYAADLLSSILADGKSSLLYEDLVYRRELARSVSAYVLPTELTATFSIVATAVCGGDSDRLEAEILAHLARLAEDGPSEAELERARNRMLTDLHDELQTLDARAELLCQCATYLGEPERAFSEPARYRAVTPDDVRAFAREHLGAAARAVVTVTPAEGRR